MARPADDPSLGELVCLALVVQEPQHGWSLVRSLAPDSSIGRVWTLSRPLTYRAIDGLLARRWIVRRAAEPGAGAMRQPLAATPAGRRAAEAWLTRPIDHIRDVRTELLVKLVLLEHAGRDATPLLAAQLAHFAPAFESLRRAARRKDADVVDRWRYESSQAVRRFLESAGSTG